jgi:hypothetical protein
LTKPSIPAFDNTSVVLKTCIGHLQLPNLGHPAHTHQIILESKNLCLPAHSKIFQPVSFVGPLAASLRFNESFNVLDTGQQTLAKRNLLNPDFSYKMFFLDTDTEEDKLEIISLAGIVSLSNVCRQGLKSLRCSIWKRLVVCFKILD